MNNLIELLNQFEDTDNWENGYQVKFRESKIISKKFGFIDWLVDNEKIDKDKVKLLSVFQETWYYNLYQSLLMILSIQDNPIEFLVSILK